VEIEKDVTERFIEIPEFDKFNSKHVKIIFMAEGDGASPKPSPIDFSACHVTCFRSCDPVEAQREMRDEW
jgi:hypothetical protein